MMDEWALSKDAFEVTVFLAPSWKEIETAPKDGTKILAFNKWGEFAVAEWVEAQKCWFAGLDDFSAPSHWMPLPPAPDFHT